MDAPAAASPLTNSPRRIARWLEQDRAGGRFYAALEAGTALLLLVVLAASYAFLRGVSAPGKMVPPPLMALLLVVNLIPAIALMVLFSRRLALRRAERSGLGSGRLHVRLVALFSVIAAVPTVLVAIFASLLLQSGLEFWFSNKARGMLENTVQLARSTYEREVNDVAGNTLAMSTDLAAFLHALPIEDPRFADYFARTQVYQRGLSEAMLFNIGKDGQIRTFAIVSPYERQLDKAVNAAMVKQLANRTFVEVSSKDRIGALIKVDYSPAPYLYAAQIYDPAFRSQMRQANDVLADYRTLLVRSRNNQLKFNAALLLGSLLIVGLAIFFALSIADRLVRPLGQLVGAAGRIEEGDFSTRVVEDKSDDEIGLLAAAFNRMTGRLEEQTGDLKSANTQLDLRRAFIEAVLSSVTAGVVAIDRDRRVSLINRSAEELLRRGSGEPEGQPLAELSEELDEFLRTEQREAQVQVAAAESGQRTLAVKRSRTQDGFVLTFDDITDQLSDQRRAAWSDIARRIAHEIKNPLTPIQLAAERLQRRYGGEIKTDPDTFQRLTETIVRQVGDLRRMVDEFSNFARMPKPVFREENLHDIARTALFLHEVAHPGISFTLDPPTGALRMVCDRRQLGQALTNVVKNAVEAIDARRSRGDQSLEGDRVALALRESDENIVIDVTDTGVGLPEDRERLTEPYMTTRVRGTGLGLAIVKKIVEEHGGEIAFLDRRGGGTHVRIAFDRQRLAALAQADEGADDRQDNGSATDGDATPRRRTDESEER
ncbi:sensor histidine kinase [Sphingomonas ginkgonis]|nr:PAS domain-containing sensor histidine kinase [Sphingomonas ginkgonis]